MHFFAYEDRSLTYRRKSENLLKVVNKAVWAIQLATALVGIILIVVASEDMFTESPLAAGAKLSFTARYAALFQSNCTTTTLVDTFILRSVPFTVNSGNVDFLVSLYVNKVVAAIVMASFACLISLVNKIIYDLNLFFYRKGYLIVRKDIVSCVEVAFLCGSIAANAIAHSFADPLQNHVQVCGGTDFQGSKNFFKAGNFAPLYIAATMPLAVHLVCWIMLFNNTVLHDTVEAPPTEAEAMENTGDEPLPDASKQKAPKDVADLEREQAILAGKTSAGAGEGGENNGGAAAPPRRLAAAAAASSGGNAAAPRIQDRPSAASGGGAAAGEAGPGGFTDLAALAYGRSNTTQASPNRADGVVDSPVRTGRSSSGAAAGPLRVMRTMQAAGAFRQAGARRGGGGRFAGSSATTPGSPNSGGADAFDPSATPSNRF